ncbi:MAG: stage II sporulation protein M [Nanoarchaeota archaeon]
MKRSAKLKKGDKGDEGFSLNKFVYGNFKSSLKSLKKIKKYIIFSLILFFMSVIIGYSFPKIFEKQVLELIKQLIEQTKGLNSFELIAFIISNNIKSAFYGLVFGVFFAIVPAVILLVNGYVLGFVANKTVASQSIFTLWRLTPHGVFEIPAILISIGFGIRLGLFLFIYNKKNKKKEFLEWLKEAARIFIFIVIPLLVIAGIIEGILIWVMS